MLTSIGWRVAIGAKRYHNAKLSALAACCAFPEGIEAQTRLAWKYILAMLTKAEMTTADLVKVTTSLTNAQDIPAYVKVRGEMLGDVRPAFMLQIVTQLIKPEVLVEVEVIAASK